MILLFPEDQLWAQQHCDKQPDSFHRFLQRLRQGYGPCFGCQSPLKTQRAHCSSCGAIFCHRCATSPNKLKLVAKRVLGVTNPDTANDKVERAAISVDRAQ
eukprot:TRINITY_DN12192_c0_g4_i2.p3 TRINITY_DN12192_c0_g4~~TRINITY_DN12192_c0_g4_i2.p3  ORF type:complete len:101 (+),score=6.90 TRINITY_DN12192_c0_g4_i2:177-479(+)